MEIIQAMSQFEQVPQGCVLTIGNFDGVHVGHQEILAVAKQTAEKRCTQLVVMTFEPHPVAVLYPERAPGVLTPLELKTDLLAEACVDCLMVLEDSRELLNLSPEAFVERFLVNNIQPSAIVEGQDFNFGTKRAGDITTLQELGRRNGFDVLTVRPRKIKLSTGQTVRVSSTIIRYMLEGGHVADAATALGRPYRLIEKVVPGRGIGRNLGFPTLNMKKPNQVIPAEGVYAGLVRIGASIQDVLRSKEQIEAVYSIGQARTYGDEFPLLIEAHLLTGDAGDLVGKFMAMDFIQRIRNQHKFNTPQELAKQITKDCEAAERILGTN
jgi:riboflavin kinase/FMN adenylyltransferase